MKISMLLIEDDRVDQMAFERQVKKENLPYEYTIAGSISDAKKSLAANRFDIIIADYMLGDGVGFDIFDFSADIPVIITTGIGNETIAVEAMKLGAYDYLIKDQEGRYLKILPITVKNACKHKNMENELQRYQHHLESLVKERTRELEAEISERKQAEKALRQSQKFNETILNTSPEMIYIFDLLEKKIIYANNSVEKILGYRVDEALEIDDEMFQSLMHPEDFTNYRRRTRERYQSAMDNEMIECTYRMKHKDGNWRWLFSRELIFLRNKDQKPRQIFGIISDISQQKKAEQETIHLEAKLKQARKMETIGTLTGGIAHDFNNILGIIIGNAELALDEIPQWNQAHLNLKEIKTAGRRAADIVKQLLSFSRKTEKKLEPMRIIPIIIDALNFLRSTIPATINIKKNFLTEQGAILADPIQINQIMMNLCINASHAMEQTGGIMTVTVDELKVNTDSTTTATYPGANPGTYIRLMIADTGPGIKAEIMDRIFDPYFTTKEVGKGSGMGLAVVLSIAKSHGGYVFAESKNGKGSCFTLLFPCVIHTPEIETKIEPDIPKGTENILLVDDEKSIVLMARQMLERLGYKVESSTKPLEALEIFKSSPEKFDLVLTDMTMPEMTGVKLTKMLKDIRQDIPVIIATGYSSQINKERAAAIGIDAYIMKPLMQQDIAKTIRKVLDRS